MILKKLKLVWTKVSDKMPLLSDKASLEKIKRFIVKVRGVPNRSITSNSKKDMDEKCDTIFDISSCRCELKTAECSDRDARKRSATKFTLSAFATERYKDSYSLR